MTGEEFIEVIVGISSRLRVMSVVVLELGVVVVQNVRGRHSFPKKSQVRPDYLNQRRNVQTDSRKEEHKEGDSEGGTRWVGVLVPKKEQSPKDREGADLERGSRVVLVLGLEFPEVQLLD